MVKVILSTIGDEKAAHAIAETMVRERLVACVNVVPQMTSVYRWKGEVKKDAEVLMIMKTVGDRIPEALRRLKQLHSYDVPEMVVLDAREGWMPYLTWVRDETSASATTMV